MVYGCKGVAVVQYPPWTLFFCSGDDVRLSFLYQKCCTLTAALCQYPSLRIFLVALCQCTSLYHSGIVPKYTLVALCQSIPLLRSDTVPMYAYLSSTVPMYTSIF